MKERLAKLIDVKSLVTLMLTLGFIYLACVAKLISGEEYKTLFTIVISFYFGTQAQKGAQRDDRITTP